MQRYTDIGERDIAADRIYKRVGNDWFFYPEYYVKELIDKEVETIRKEVLNGKLGS